MSTVAIVIGIVGICAAIGIYVRFSMQVKQISEKRAELEGRLSHLEARRKKAERRIDEITERARRLERELAEAVARRDEKAVANALWNLELERSERQWRDVVLPNEVEGNGDSVSSGRRLAYAIQHEVDRLREEVGVAIRFEGDLDCELGPEAAIASLRISEELLAAASKHADQVAVVLDQGDEPSIAIQFLCDGWDGDLALEDSEMGGNLKSMARRLDGWIRYEQPDSDTLHVSVRLPAGKPLEVAPVPMQLTSSAFAEKTPIPDRYTKLNENLSPPLHWTDAPPGSVELALTCHDPDAPAGVFVHWLVAGIQTDAPGSDEGKAPPGAVVGRNDYGDDTYGGPRPPVGDPAHRYFFRVHACSKPLGLAPGFSDEQLQKALSGSEIASATLVGIYQRV